MKLLKRRLLCLVIQTYRKKEKSIQSKKCLPLMGKISIKTTKAKLGLKADSRRKDEKVVNFQGSIRSLHVFLYLPAPKSSSPSWPTL